eukprot:12043269-Alexandrium_andersonii.AAC.1
MFVLTPLSVGLSRAVGRWSDGWLIGGGTVKRAMSLALRAPVVSSMICCRPYIAVAPIFDSHSPIPCPFLAVLALPRSIQ